MSWDLTVRGLKRYPGDPVFSSSDEFVGEGPTFTCETSEGVFGQCQDRFTNPITMDLAVDGAVGEGSYAGMTLADLEPDFLLLYTTRNYFATVFFEECVGAPSGHCDPEGGILEISGTGYHTGSPSGPLLGDLVPADTFGGLPSGAPPNANMDGGYIGPPSVYGGDPTNDLADYLWPADIGNIFVSVGAACGKFYAAAGVIGELADSSSLGIIPYQLKKTRRVAIV